MHRVKCSAEVYIDQITTEALRLNSHDRAILAEVIWESLEEPFTLKTNISEADAITFAKQRDIDIESGKSKTITHKELMNLLKDEN